MVSVTSRETRWVWSGCRSPPEAVSGGRTSTARWAGWRSAYGLVRCGSPQADTAIGILSGWRRNALDRHHGCVVVQMTADVPHQVLAQVGQESGGTFAGLVGHPFRKRVERASRLRASMTPSV